MFNNLCNLCYSCVTFKCQETTNCLPDESCQWFNLSLWLFDGEILVGILNSTCWAFRPLEIFWKEILQREKIRAGKGDRGLLQFNMRIFGMGTSLFSVGFPVSAAPGASESDISPKYTHPPSITHHPATWYDTLTPGTNLGSRETCWATWSGSSCNRDGRRSRETLVCLQSLHLLCICWWFLLVT